MPDKLSKEQRAHDLAIVLCKQHLINELVPCEKEKTFEFVKMYEHYYKYALESFEDFI